MTQDMTNKGFQIHFLLLFLLLILGGSKVWGQTLDEGFYYIANNNKENYNSSNQSANFYLTAATGCYYTVNDSGVTTYVTDDNGMPFLTTYKSFFHSASKDAIWQVNKYVKNNTTYYRFINNGKQLVANDPLVVNNQYRRIAVHLEDVETVTDNSLFVLTKVTGKDYYTIRPKDVATTLALNPATNNYDQTGPVTSLGNGYGGLIGLGNSTDRNSFWYFESASSESLVAAPTITYADGTITMNTFTTEAAIKYTTDGSAPTSTSTQYSSPININVTSFPYGPVYTIKALAQKGENSSQITSQLLDRSLTTPIISIAENGNKATITISSSQDGVQFYYSTDGTNPSKSSGTHYVEPFEITINEGIQTVVKAVAVSTVSESDYTSSVEEVLVGASDLSGLYYIQSVKSTGNYLNVSTTKNASDELYATTGTTRNETAVWQLIKNEAYYYIKHYADDTYLTADPSSLTNSAFLSATPSDNALFSVTKDDEQILIKPKNANNEGSDYICYNGTNSLILGANTSDEAKWKLVDIPSKPWASRSDIVVTLGNQLGDIYYTIGISSNDEVPTSSSIKYTTPFYIDYGPQYKIRYVSIYKDKQNEEHISEEAVFSPKIGVAEPQITYSYNASEEKYYITVSNGQQGVSYRYTTNGDTPSATSGTEYNGPFPLAAGEYTINAIAYNTVSGTAYPSAVITQTVQLVAAKVISSYSGIEDLAGSYILAQDFSPTGTLPEGDFTGMLDGQYHPITLTAPLFNTVNGATIKNVVIESANISGSGNAGAICKEATGTTRIYNCGVLGGSISGSGSVGGIVGKISDNTRVVNCYNYASISGGTYAGGVVGQNDGTTTRVALCMMYGDLRGGSSGSSPVYAGNHTSNSQNFTEYNFWRSKASVSYSAYNDQLAIDKDEYLTRFPFYRHILNTHRELASYFLFGDYAEIHVSEIGHWVLKKDVAYPIIEEWKTNTKKTTQDIKKNLPSTTATGAGKLLNNIGDDGYYTGDGTKVTAMGNAGYLKVYVTINGTSCGSVDLPITDMNEANYDYTWGKVVLPFANEFSGWDRDYSRICTGWEITSITGGTAGSFANYDVADRDCTAKDLYANTDYIFAQGGNYIVPYGVTSISINAHFAKAYYLSDASYEMGYNDSFSGQTYLGGIVPTTYHGQTVYTSLSTLVSQLENTTNPHDQAIVLVGNFHYNIKTLGGSILNKEKAITIMSVDEDNNQEPDYGWYTCNTSGRLEVPPLRFDFVPNIEMGMSSRVGSSIYPGIGIWHTRGWFELTETCVSNMIQCEINSSDFTNNDNDKGNNRWIANSGCFVQIVRARDGKCTKLSYIQIGGNAYVKELYPGSHSDQARENKAVPIIVTGGQVDECYMTGYTAGGTLTGDMLYFWSAGGKIGKFLGAYLEEPTAAGLTAKVDHALVGRFFGGGTSSSARIKGNINVIINNCVVDFYCGGPEFGNMSSGKVVTTHAIGTTFGKYYGGGFGGTSITYNRERQNSGVTFSTATKAYDLPFTHYTNFRLKRSDAVSHNSQGGVNPSSYLGLGTCYKFEYIYHSDGSKGVSRFFTGYAQFDLATTGNVINDLKNCKISGDFYGAGCQGKVDGTVTSTLTDCVVEGSAFGGGYKSESNEVDVYPTTQPTYSVYTKETGIFSEFGTVEPEHYYWVQGDANHDDVAGTGENAGKLFTSKDIDMTELGDVTGAISLTITTTESGESTIGTAGDGSTGNVFGGGNESLSLNNVSVTINGNTKVLGSVYGGGNIASVGTFTKNDDDKPTSCTENTGKCTVVISGNAEIGPNGMQMPAFSGHVFGAGKGTVDPLFDDYEKTEAAKQDAIANMTDGELQAKLKVLEGMAYVNNTDVTISGSAFVKGSVYGGSENGHVLANTNVKIQENCQIGNGDGINRLYTDEDWNSTSLKECASWSYDVTTTGVPYDKYHGTTGYDSKGGATTGTDGHTFYGNVYGGGSGYFPYAPGKWLRSAGSVEGKTVVNIKGGHVLSCVYGGNEVTDVTGNCTINMSDGTVGVPRTKDERLAHPVLGNVFGAGKGDKRVLFNTWTNVGNTSVNISGGKVYGSVFGGGEDGHVLNNAVTTISQTPVIGITGESGFDGNVFGGGRGSSTALTAGVVGGNVTLNIQGGEMKGSVYGGGRLASVGTHFTNPEAEDYGKLQTPSDAHGNITVNLTAGVIHQNVYGGCMGIAELDSENKRQDALGISNNVLLKLNKNVAEDAKGCIVKGNIFGCNNVNSTPKGNVEVHVYGTQNADASQIANTEANGNNSAVTNAKVSGRYDVKAVYGGGNLAAYVPTVANASTNVIIDGCDLTSIQTVYGGGDAASTPATSVTVNGTFEIEEVFGGGNGLDALSDGRPNPGANVGYKNYTLYKEEAGEVVAYDATDADTKEHRVEKYAYGSGAANVTIYGGIIHRVFGGSNTKGNVRFSAVTMLDNSNDCDFRIDEAYGGGKSASMDAEAVLHMACIPGLSAAYGGAEAADIRGDVTLTITNGTFDQVFGGNNISGTIAGVINVNIEETGCKPVIIGELYGGGNQAPYSGHDGSGPTVNVRSFTSIGDIYGGGYGHTAIVTGNTTVNINVSEGKYKDTVIGENATTETIRKNDAEAEGGYPVPSHAEGKIGSINNVYGGGNAADVVGNTTVNIGTLATNTFVSLTDDGETGDVDERVKEVLGVDIRGNVYGGGNEAAVTGNTNVQIGVKDED